jgi:hypothetical protein
VGKKYGFVVVLFDQFCKLIYPGYYCQPGDFWYMPRNPLTAFDHPHISRYRIFLILAGQHIYYPDQLQYAQYYQQRLLILKLFAN